jgi:hypothetical protein
MARPGLWTSLPSNCDDDADCPRDPETDAAGAGRRRRRGKLCRRRPTKQHTSPLVPQTASLLPQCTVGPLGGATSGTPVSGVRDASTHSPLSQVCSASQPTLTQSAFKSIGSSSELCGVKRRVRRATMQPA